MPATTKTTHRGHTITFTEADHTYIDDQGHHYTSVTTVAGRYLPMFDAPATAARMESQGRGNAADLQAQWKATADAACAFGTRCHAVAEDTLLARPQRNTPTTDRERSAFRAVWQFCTERLMVPAVQILGVEEVVFSPALYIAGTIDLLANINGTPWVLDWKTNEAIPREGFRGEMALPPVSDMPACAWTKYIIQLGLYERILREQGHVHPLSQIRRGLLWVHDAPAGWTVDILEIPSATLATANILLDHLSTDIPF